jgi:orotidine-5'-phosphate decarboxylase
LGQQYSTPNSVVGTRMSDVVIVGRGIYGAADPKAEAQKYQKEAWASYEARTANK